MRFYYKYNIIVTAEVLCQHCKYGISTSIHVLKNTVLYYGFNCKKKGNLSAYIFNVQQCSKFKEYNSKETFMEHVKNAEKR